VTAISHRAGQAAPVLARGCVPEAAAPLLLPLDKPAGWTSFDVIRALRRILGVRKIGHAGTLDPMATGLLICGTGQATRDLSRFADMDKEYTGVMRLGEETASFDAETPVLERRDAGAVTDGDIEDVRKAFVGDIIQYVPAYSAVKVEGERLYRRARRGEVVSRPPRSVRVVSFEVLDRSGPDVSFRIRCSKGTYIRSIAHDVGRQLGVGAHLIQLRRTQIGDVGVESSWQVSEIETCREFAALRTDTGPVSP